MSGRHSCRSSLMAGKLESKRQERTDSLLDFTAGLGKVDRRLGRSKFRQKLPAGSAGRTCGVVEVHDTYCMKADMRPELSDGPHHRRSLRAYRQPIARVFHVSAGNNFAVIEQERSSNPEAGIRGISVFRCFDRHPAQAFSHCVVDLFCSSHAAIVCRDASAVKPGRKLYCNSLMLEILPES